MMFSSSKSMSSGIGSGVADDFSAAKIFTETLSPGCKRTPLSDLSLLRRTSPSAIRRRMRVRLILGSRVATNSSRRGLSAPASNSKLKRSGSSIASRQVYDQRDRPEDVEPHQPDRVLMQPVELDARRVVGHELRNLTEAHAQLMHPSRHGETRHERRDCHQRDRDQFIEKSLVALPRKNQDDDQQGAYDHDDDFEYAESPRHQRAGELLLAQRGEGRGRDHEAEKSHRAKPQTQNRESDFL